MPDRQTDSNLSGTTATAELERLQLKHQQCDDRLAELRRRLILSEEEKVEEVNLKKQKLMLKDRMEALARSAQALPSAERR